ncbi:MAG TPA: hypothetical protein PKK23_06650 [Nitrospirales bacterium]|nr:hypothetical protein [Nitrospiraceae bacterium]HNP28704.1 hypothetical protein [Nitrospirales bacterium]
MKKRPRRHHSPEFKHEPVGLVVEYGCSCGAAGSSLGASGALIGRCKYELEAHKAEAFSGNGKRFTEQQRIHELEEGSRRLRMERRLVELKAAYFAKNPELGMPSFCSIKTGMWCSRCVPDWKVVSTVGFSSRFTGVYER